MANQEQLERLLEGVETWNKWRIREPDTIIDLVNADLRDAYLPGINLRNAQLARCDLRDAVLDGANVIEAVASNANLTGAQLQNADFTGANARYLNLTSVQAKLAVFNGALLRNAILTSADLEGADLSNVNLKDANAVRTNLSKAKLKSTDFRDAKMDHAVFDAAEIEYGDFRRCNLNRATFVFAKLNFSRFRNANLQSIELRGADIKKADFRRANNLSCEILSLAKNWEQSYRDHELSCGESIPEFLEGTLIVSNNTDQFFSEMSSIWNESIPDEQRADQVLQSRTSLEDLVEELDTFNNVLRGRIGHNNPPDSMVSEEVIKQLKSEILAGIELHAAPRPNKQYLRTLNQTLHQFRQWLQPRIDKAADTIIVAGAVSLVAKLSKAWDEIKALIDMLN
ncbi:MAG: pentapeptide repeat-containing protein [Alphaproteobacteria bacterium]